MVWAQTNLSCNKFSGYFEPGGNKGGGLASAFEESTVSFNFEDLDEFPALPDLTIPFLGGIQWAQSKEWVRFHFAGMPHVM